MKHIEKMVLGSLAVEPKTLWKLIHEIDARECEIVPLLNKMLKTGGIEHKGGMFQLKEQNGAKQWSPVKCSACDGTGIGLSKEMQQVHKKFTGLTEKAYDAPHDELQQARIRIVDAIRKTQLMYNKGDLIGQDIFILGDDDYMSIALALTGLPKSIRVLEIDEPLIDEINRIAKENNLDVTAEKYDAREELPADCKGAFDVFLTDPPDCVTAMAAFVSRCAESLRQDGIGYFGLTMAESSAKDWQDFQAKLLEMNFIVTDIVRQFTTYPEGEYEWPGSYNKMPIKDKVKFELAEPDLDWYTASLYRVRSVGKPNQIVKGRIEIGKDFYKGKSAWTVAID